MVKAIHFSLGVGDCLIFRFGSPGLVSYYRYFLQSNQFFSLYDIPKNDIIYIFVFFVNSKYHIQRFNINTDNMFFQDIEIYRIKNKNNLSNCIKIS